MNQADDTKSSKPLGSLAGPPAPNYTCTHGHYSRLDERQQKSQVGSLRTGFSSESFASGAQIESDIARAVHLCSPLLSRFPPPLRLTPTPPVPGTRATRSKWRPPMFGFGVAGQTKAAEQKGPPLPTLGLDHTGLSLINWNVSVPRCASRLGVNDRLGLTLDSPAVSRRSFEPQFQLATQTHNQTGPPVV